MTLAVDHERRKMTRMERVQHTLKTVDDVCSLADLYANALSNGRNDISELRRRGWIIDKYPTSHGDGPNHTHYRLVSAPSGAIRGRQTSWPMTINGEKRMRNA
jgi:hypothetical protein